MQVVLAVIVGLALGQWLPLRSAEEPSLAGAGRTPGAATSPAPPSSSRGSAPLQATFTLEDTDGGDAGPLRVWDPATSSIVWEAPGRTSLSAAHDLALEHGWTLFVDG